jgi:hypothetical protein
VRVILRSVLFAVVVTCCLISCGREEEIDRVRESEREAWRQAEFWREDVKSARERAAAERRRSRADRHRASMQVQHAQAEAEQARLDRSGAMIVWVATAGALFVVILVLARERRLRRLLTAVLRRLLRQEESHG